MDYLVNYARCQSSRTNLRGQATPQPAGHRHTPQAIASSVRTV